MNKMERVPAIGREAIVVYLDADFQVKSPGTHVFCAITGARIPLEQLHYWSVDKQVAYVDAHAVLVSLGAAGRSARKP